MSALAVSTAQPPQSQGGFDDPFEALNSIGVKGSENHVPSSSSVGPGKGDLGSFVEHVNPLATMAMRDHGLVLGLHEAQASPLQTGWNAAQEGEASMRQWARFQLGVVKGAPLPAEVKLFQDGGFARGLAGRWNTLIDKTMPNLPAEARKAYERVLNDEMHQAMQLAMLQDAAIDEYTPIKVREFSADGQGGTHEFKLEDSTVASTKTLQQQDAAAQQQMQLDAQEESSLRQKFGFDGANAMTLAGRSLDRQDGYTRVDLARPAVEFRIDTASISKYQNAKFTAAVDYAQQFAEVARGGIVAIAMGKQYANQWLAGELGFVDGKPYEGLKDGKEAPNTRALAERWGKLSNETLMAMPEFLREKYAPLANQTMQRGVHATMHMDAQIGKYAGVNLRDFTPGGPGEEFKYFLNQDGSLGREVIKKKDDGNCVDQILLPIVNVALYFVPVVGAVLGGAMTVAMAVKSGVETGNWVGAGIGAVAGVVGMGGAWGAMAGELGAMGGAAGSVGSALEGVGGAFSGAGESIFGEAAGAIGSAVSTGVKVARVAQSAYGLEQGIENGNPLSAIQNGAGLVGAVAQFGSNDPWGDVKSEADVVNGDALQSELNPSVVNGALMTGANLAARGVQLFEGFTSGNPLSIASGVTGLVGDLAPKEYKDEAYALHHATNALAATVYGNSAMAGTSTAFALAHWNEANGDQAAGQNLMQLGAGMTNAHDAINSLALYRLGSAITA
jgi:hypothetical protein